MSYFLLPRIYNKYIIQNIIIEFQEKNENYINDSISQYLKQLKGQIELNMGDWERFKKMTNAYEYIHTNVPHSGYSISLLKPISRSFFKLVEIYNLLDINFKNNIKSFHLAEGPGGFVEGIKFIRNNPNDIYHGMTLISNKNPSIPGWKKAQKLIQTSNIRIIVGPDKSGDLYNPINLEYCRDKFYHSMDFITGDGGFDFSIDYNKQEELALRLIFSQVAFAITMQKYGGVFILKMFDIFLKPSIDILFILSSLYEKVLIIKPRTSRIANSERYIVCKNFLLKKGPSSNELIQKFCYILYNFKKHNFSNQKIKSILNIEIPLIFLNKLSEINSILAYEQINNILYTLKIIKKKEKITSDMIQRNISRSIKWCQKYGIPFRSKIDYENCLKFICN